MTNEAKFEQWANVELMGHQRVVGRCSEQALAGTNMLRVDIPEGESFTTRYYSGSAVYCITPVSEEVARKLCAGLKQEPSFVWSLKEHPKAMTYEAPDNDYENDQDH